MDEFGQRLRKAFSNAKNAEIARQLDVSEPAVKNYIAGRVPDADKLRLISNLTKCSLHWLLTGEGNQFVPEVVEELSTYDSNEKAHQRDIDAIEEYLENYQEDDELIVSPEEKFFVGSLEDFVVKIIQENVPKIVRNEIALANGEKLSNPRKRSGAPSFEIGKKQGKENKAA